MSFIFTLAAAKKGRYTHEMRTETINSSRSYWSNTEETCAKKPRTDQIKPRVEEATSTVEITHKALPVNHSTTEPPTGKIKVETSSSQCLCLPTSSTDSEVTCPFSSPLHSSIAHDVINSREAQVSMTSKGFGGNDVTGELSPVKKELHAENDDVTPELQAINKMIRGSYLLYFDLVCIYLVYMANVLPLPISHNLVGLKCVI